MRILFVGTVDFSRHCLQVVLNNGGNVVGILTLNREDALFHADYADLSDMASHSSIPLWKIKDINHFESVKLIRNLEPDIMFAFGWSQLLSRRILEIPARGCIGAHPALLPRNRGRHPIVWALVEGLIESGLTFFHLDEGADSGDILWQKAFPISLEDDAGSLYEKVKSLAVEGIKELLPKLESRDARRIPQDHSQATYWRTRNEKDGEIHWESSTMGSYNLIRALTRPYVGAHTYAHGKKIIIWRAMLPRAPLPIEARSVEPGTVFAQTDTRFDVRTGDGYLSILEYEMMSRGTLDVGTRLGDQP